MSEESLASLLSRLKDDAELGEILKSASDLDTAVSIANESGCYVSKAAWDMDQEQNAAELSEEDLDGSSGGLANNIYKASNCDTSHDS